MVSRECKKKGGEYEQKMVLAEATRDYRANVDRIREGRARFFGFSGDEARVAGHGRVKRV